MKFIFNKDNFIQTKKFKNISLIISFAYENLEDKLWYYRLITDILNRECEKYPSKKLLINKALSLYGANVSIGCLQLYKTAALNASIDIVNPNYVGSATLFNDAFDLLSEMILRPNLNEDKTGFNEKTFIEAKKIYIDGVKNLPSNKRRYAMAKLLEYTKKDEDFKLDYSLDLDSLECITNKELYEFYKTIINNSTIIAYGIGDYDSNIVKEKIDALNLNTNDNKLESFSKKNVIIDKENYFEEIQDLKQAKLNISFRTSIDRTNKLYPALVIFSEMFGEMFNSSLVSNIREKRGLCYTISSSNRCDNLLIVSAGIDNANDKITIDLIKEELNKYKTGNIENAEELLKEAKDTIEFEYYDTQDSTFKILIKNVIASFPGRRTAKALVDDCNKVTLDEVIEVSKSLTLDTIFVLKGENKNE